MANVIPKIDKGIESIAQYLKRYTAIFVLALAGWLGWLVYQGLDQSGWIVHHHEAWTYLGKNWMVGEYRNCHLVNNFLLNDTRDNDALECENGEPTPEPHLLPVAFHGRIDRKDRALFTFRCQRHQESLECWALD